jgi:hypothetical protein
MAALPDEGRNHLPKHVIVNVMNARRYIHIYCCINRRINKYRLNIYKVIMSHKKKLQAQGPRRDPHQ